MIVELCISKTCSANSRICIRGVFLECEARITYGPADRDLECGSSRGITGAGGCGSLLVIWKFCRLCDSCRERRSTAVF